MFLQYTHLRCLRSILWSREITCLGKEKKKPKNYSLDPWTWICSDFRALTTGPLPREVYEGITSKVPLGSFVWSLYMIKPFTWMYSFSTSAFSHWKPLSLVLLLNDKTGNRDLVTKSTKGDSECSEAQVETRDLGSPYYLQSRPLDRQLVLMHRL